MYATERGSELAGLFDKFWMYIENYVEYLGLDKCIVEFMQDKQRTANPYLLGSRRSDSKCDRLIIIIPHNRILNQ